MSLGRSIWNCLTKMLEEIVLAWHLHHLSMLDLPTLQRTREQLAKTRFLEEKLEVLLQLARPLTWGAVFSDFFSRKKVEEKIVLTSLIALGVRFEEHRERWEPLLQQMVSVDRFYREIGGLIGYQVELLQRLQATPRVRAIYHSPPFDDISVPNPEHIWSGLLALEHIAEIYPLGGAADRLHLVEEKTGAELPAAKLQFAGRTLLEGLIRDVQAREWLVFRLFGKQFVTPIAMMTSWEKENHRHVLEICDAHRWFGRPKESFRTFTQPLVPTVDDQGRWHTIGPFKLLLKPGGHGALWKCARDEGIFAWLRGQGRVSVLVRQINNPIAGLDHGLLAFTGIGFSRKQSFGFASCPRRVQAAEGMNVLVETEQGELALTNIEYCDFAKYGIQDLPLKEGEPFSRFSSNTNILYANLNAIESAVAKHPFPGLLVNLKKGSLLDEKGVQRHVPLARLESTMQNIADVLVEPKGTELRTKETFVTYNHRHKTISVAKKAFTSGNLAETPELCFHELMIAHRELLSLCGIEAPELRSVQDYLEKGPSFVFLYHPALGPLYSVIQQKLRGGRLFEGAELVLELAELNAENLSVDGSFCIRAAQPLGFIDPETGLLTYNHQIGRCRLRNVRVTNRGVNWSHSAPFWKANFQRYESLEIELRGHSEFDAADVRFERAEKFVVEDGERLVVREENGKRRMWREPVGEKLLWTYRWENGVKLYH